MTVEKAIEELKEKTANTYISDETYELVRELMEEVGAECYGVGYLDRKQEEAIDREY